jgi:hypothetical protein
MEGESGAKDSSGAVRFIRVVAAVREAIADPILQNLLAITTHEHGAVELV